MNKTGVIGAGQMGLGIAQLFAQSGFLVVLNDMSEEILEGAKQRLKASLSKLCEKGKLSSEESQQVFSRFLFTTKHSELSDCDLVLEAIVENMDIKKKLFSELDGLCKKETIFASNTSSISITEMASATKRADKFVGMHFFNPAGVMKLVEVIRGFETSDETFQSIFCLAQKLGKDPIEVMEGPGFVVNRLLIPMINEAANVLGEGIASAEHIDKAMMLGANHKMGPLALSDLIGNDTVLSIMNTLYSETGDPKYRPSTLLIKMVRAKKLGRKTKEGFFTY